MTEIEQAKAHFNYGVKCDIFSEPVTSYAKIAISAIEKQIPKKPSETDKARCIHCACVVKRDERFCKNCGQALDWSE